MPHAMYNGSIIRYLLRTRIIAKHFEKEVCTYLYREQAHQQNLWFVSETTHQQLIS